MRETPERGEQCKTGSGEIRGKAQVGSTSFVVVVVVVVYHVTSVVIGHGLLKKFWTAFYALQGVTLFETMQTRLLH